MKLGRGFAVVLLLALGCGEDGTDDGNGPAPGENAGGEDQNVAQIQPRESATDQLIEALGGAESLDALTRLRIEGEGTRFIPNEGERPEDAPIEANAIFLQDNIALYATVMGHYIGDAHVPLLERELAAVQET